jgi:hypothetical protein
VIDDELLVKTRTNTCLSYASAIPSYSVTKPSLNSKYRDFLASQLIEPQNKKVQQKRNSSKYLSAFLQTIRHQSR